jgi:O-antigen/teichoic acid export membrane protein
LRIPKPTAFVRDLLITGLTSILSTVAAVAMIRVLAGQLGPDEFGAYSLARRTLGTLVPIATMGVGIALPRYVATASDELASSRYLVAALLLGTAPSVAILIAGTVASGPLTHLIFRAEAYRSLFRATLWLTLGNSVYGALYAYYRGLNRMQMANLWQAAVVAGGPLVVAALFAGSGRADLIVALCAVLMLCAAAPLGIETIRAVIVWKRHAVSQYAFEQIARYGVPRVPAGFALAGLFAVGPFLAPYFASLREAGYLAAGQGVLMAAEAGMAAFGLVALPKVARMVADGRHAEVREAVQHVVAAVLHLGLFAVLQGLLWADEIVLGLLGPRYREAIPILRLLLIALMPYLTYVVLRSILDAVEDKAINTFNLLVSLGVCLGASVVAVYAGLGARGLAIGTVAGFLALGATTLHYLVRTYPFPWRSLRVPEILVLSVASLLLGIPAKLGLESACEGAVLLVGAAVVVTIISVLYLGALWWLGVDWLVELRSRLAPAPRDGVETVGV